MKKALAILNGFLLCLPMVSLAQEAWDGGGSDNQWTTPENWADDSIPANPYTGTIYFTNEGDGTNVVDADWETRSLVFTNSLPEIVHILDLNGNTLSIPSTLQVWQFDSQVSGNTFAMISNGTLQLGTGSGAPNLYVTYIGGNTPNNYLATNIAASISADITVTNWGNFYVACHNANYYNGTIIEGSLDLSRSTIVSDGVSNQIRCANFVLGGAERDTSARGRLRLPPAITTIETGDFIVGGGGRGNGWGYLDLGEGSQLESIIARTKFWYGAGSDAVISNWPGTVDLTVGTSNSPASFRVGSGVCQVSGIGASLVVSNSVLQGILDDFLVGTSLRYNYGRAITGHVDLARSAIHTGGESNALHCTELRIGAQNIGMNYNSSSGEGSLYLPPTLKTIRTGFFQLGCMNRGFGLLDLGTNSQLEDFTVTGDFYYGYSGGGAFLRGMPTNGVTFSIGTPEAPSFLAVGVNRGREYVYDGEADLVLENADFTAHLRNAEIGVSHYYGKYDHWAVGKLDLRESALNTFDVTDSLIIGHGYNTPSYQTYKRAVGRVSLPEGTVNIATNLLMGDTISPSLALLDLYGTRVTVGEKVDLWPTATFNARVQGVSAGLDMLSTAAETLSVSNGAVINILFEQDPEDMNQRRYSGFSMAGDRVGELETLHADGGLQWDTSGLSSRWTRRVGIYYDPVENLTYVGFDPRPRGTLILLR